MRLDAQNPTRLFIDAKNTNGWRKKGFYSLINNSDTNKSYNDSIMIHMLYDKKKHPKVIGSYQPEKDELVCPKNKKEMSEYIEDKPNHGMPYGFPAIKDTEYNTLAQWLAQGSKGPTKKEQEDLTKPSKNAQKQIAKWEAFLNKSDAKHSVTARYLYEHFYLAHWYFTDAPNEFFEIVRSKTPSPQKIDTIASIRPFDDPNIDKFYYRLQKIHSTIVHKTHMVVKFNDAKLKRLKKLFIKPKWVEKPHYISYETKLSANPFLAFYQIPAKSRYQFLLNNSHYIVMTFIRGPVCRGQMALNVIHDNFWVMFKDPKYDLTLQNPNFILSQADNLSMPIETSSQKLLDTFSDAYREKYARYFIAKETLYDKTYPDGEEVKSIWKGDRAEDAPLLTIYRHFDSASVHKGVIGELPRTAWVIDYPQFERIYYSLVAGYDVFGNISHQTNVRRYMDFLRIEGELNFLAYMPKNKRLKMLKSWYINDADIEDRKSLPEIKRKTRVRYKTIYPKGEFIQKIVKNHILKSTKIDFDNINYYKEYEARPTMPKSFKTIENLRDGVRSLTTPGTNFIKHMSGGNVNTMFVRILKDDGSSIVLSIVVNRWHDNVNSLFGEKNKLNPNKDTLDFIEGYVGSYPNSFAFVNYKDLPDFLDVIKNFDGSDLYIKKLLKYFISRRDKRFWDAYDWFQNDFNKKNPINSGLFDLNRYYHK
ncbi:MAG: peptidylprolyl isomerase [Epsilonproteobacteria bacterium]|nr:peptidylprolyl isomerase [Campylobacterota bacterium]